MKKTTNESRRDRANRRLAKAARASVREWRRRARQAKQDGDVGAWSYAVITAAENRARAREYDSRVA